MLMFAVDRRMISITRHSSGKLVFNEAIGLRRFLRFPPRNAKRFSIAERRWGLFRCFPKWHFEITEELFGEVAAGKLIYSLGNCGCALVVEFPQDQPEAASTAACSIAPAASQIFSRAQGDARNML